jgi:hypothetical protein
MDTSDAALVRHPAGDCPLDLTTRTCHPFVATTTWSSLLASHEIWVAGLPLVTIRSIYRLSNRSAVSQSAMSPIRSLPTKVRATSWRSPGSGGPGDMSP